MFSVMPKHKINYGIWFLIASLLLLLDGLPETFLEQGQFRHEICDCVGECVLRGVLGGGLDAEDEFVFQWVREFVAGKEDVWVFQELTGRGEELLIE